jgi:hypothetical protein
MILIVRIGLCGDYGLRNSSMFDGTCSVVGTRFHLGNIDGEASEECQRCNFWVDHRCSHFDDKAGTHQFL